MQILKDTPYKGNPGSISEAEVSFGWKVLCVSCIECPGEFSGA